MGVKQTLTAILKDSICFFHTSLFFRLPSVVALYWHCIFLFLQRYIDIGHKNTWLSFELLQCESLDLPLLFVFVHNYYKWTVSICLFKPPWLGALYSHWLQGHLTFLWTDSMWVFRSSIVVCFCSHLLPMNCFYMSLQTSLAWGFIFTLITGIFDFLMDWFNVCL